MEENIYEKLNISPLTDFNSEQSKQNLNILIAEIDCKIAENRLESIKCPQKAADLDIECEKLQSKKDMLQILLDPQKREKYNNRPEIRTYIYRIRFPELVEKILNRKIPSGFYVEEISLEKAYLASNLELCVSIFRLTDKWVETATDRADIFGEKAVENYVASNTPYITSRDYYSMQRFSHSKESIETPEYIRDLDVYGFKLEIPTEFDSKEALDVFTTSKGAELEKKYSLQLTQKGVQNRKPILRRLLGTFWLRYSFETDAPSEEELDTVLELLEKIKDHRAPTNDKSDTNESKAREDER